MNHQPVKPKAFLVLDSEFSGHGRDVCGRVLDEQGHVLAQHVSSSLSWLRRDLTSHINADEYEVVDQLMDQLRDTRRSRPDVGDLLDLLERIDTSIGKSLPGDLREELDRLFTNCRDFKAGGQ